MKGVIVFEPKFLVGKDRPVAVIGSVMYAEGKDIRQFSSSSEGVVAGPCDKEYKTLEDAREAWNHEYKTAAFVEVDDVDELKGMLGNYLPESTG